MRTTQTKIAEKAFFSRTQNIVAYDLGKAITHSGSGSSFHYKTCKSKFIRPKKPNITTKASCSFLDGEHELTKCKSFADSSPTNKYKFVRSKNCAVQTMS
jgi:hypothetical protein